MSEAADHPIRFHRPRKPWETPLHRLIEEHFDDFERVYPDRFQLKHGFWRPVVNDYLDCGHPREGFARVRGWSTGFGVRGQSIFLLSNP